MTPVPTTIQLHTTVQLHDIRYLSRIIGSDWSMYGLLSDYVYRGTGSGGSQYLN